MARQHRIQFPGALYHVMARGNRRGPVFLADGDRTAFLKAVGDMCARTGIRVHAYVLLENHYHLVLETPEGNLVEGVRWLQNAYTRRFNVYHKLWGHLFGGRYNALVVDAEGAYFRHVVDYVHLNPARAGLVAPGEGLERYPWSSLTHIVGAPSSRPDWLVAERVLETSGLRDTAAGRRAYLERLELRSRNEGAAKAGLVDPNAALGLSLQTTIRRGWYFGSQAFRERLLALLGSPRVAAGQDVSNGYHGAQARDHGVAWARHVLENGCAALGTTLEELRARKRADADKVALAELLASRSSVRLDWVREELGMGSRGYCSRLVQARRRQLEHDEPLRASRARLAQKCNII